MATQLKEGDTVQIVDREATPADEKSQTFFNHYRNLRGILEKTYEDGLATVVVDEESLPEEIKQRHGELTQTAKKKWLDSLSNEARNKLTADEQQFKMRYSVLVEVQDLVKAGAKPAKPKTEAAEKVEKAQSDESKAVSSSELDKIEEEYLKSRHKEEA